MSLYKDASLAMIPTAYKDGKLYSVRPTDGSGDFTFTRGSNLSATRVNASQLIEKGRENVLLQSNSLDTSPWVKNQGATLVSGQSGYDGSSDAWRINITNVSNSGLYQAIPLSGVYSYSIYAKAGDINYLGFTNFAGSNYDIFFNLSNGTIANQSGFIDATITSAGNGFYRCTLTSVNPVYLQMKPSSTASGTSTAGYIFMQDLQVELGLVATPYIETGASTAQAGILENTPRFDYSGGATCPSLLLEPLRSNLVTQSEYFASSDWIKINSTITNNSVVSPEGLQNAATHTNTASNQVFLYQYPSGTGTTFTCSVFAKKNTNKYLGITMLYDSDTQKRYQVIFNLEDGTFAQQKDTASTLTNRDYDIEDYGNGWYRCSITSTGTNGRPYMVLQNSNILSVSFGDISLDWDDATIGSAYYYGATLEAGSYPTSYIPTYGVSQTRALDNCLKTGVSSLIGQSNGTLFVEVGVFPKETNGRIFGISDGSTSKYIIIIKNSTNTDFAVYVTNNGGQVTYQGTGSLNDNSKIAVGYANNDYVIYVNGTQVHTDTSASVPTCSNIYVGQRENGSGTYVAGGSVKQALLFKTRLSNAELASLTTI